MKDDTQATTAPAPVCKPGQDPTELLTVAELDMIGRRIGGDPVTAISEGLTGRWKALALIGWCLDKRRDVRVPESAWMGLTLPQLMEALGMEDDDTPEAAQARQAAEAEADRENPTAPTPAPE